MISIIVNTIHEFNNVRKINYEGNINKGMISMKTFNPLPDQTTPPRCLSRDECLTLSHRVGSNMNPFSKGGPAEGKSGGRLVETKITSSAISGDSKELSSITDAISEEL